MDDSQGYCMKEKSHYDNIPMKGDTVMCLVHDFDQYAYKQIAYVHDVYHRDDGAWLIKLTNFKSPTGHTWYMAYKWKLQHRNKQNQEKENQMASYEKTKYFVIAVDEGASTPTFLVPDSASIGPLRDTKSEALKDAELRIRGEDAGRKLIILQTIALIQEEDPRPPIKITEYK